MLSKHFWFETFEVGNTKIRNILSYTKMVKWFNTVPNTRWLILRSKMVR